MTTKKRNAGDAGYATIRITKKAHKELIARALKEQRTLITTLDRILGV